MILEKDFLNKLKDFGLNSYEAKLWTALLSRGVSTAGELSDIANVPRSRTYDVLESLEKKGFIIMKLGKPIKYLAVDPSEVITRIKKTVQDDANIQLRMLSELDESPVLNELELLHKQGVEMVTPSDLSGSFRSRDAMYNQIDAMIRSADESIVLVSNGPGIIEKLNTFKRSLSKAVKRGVQVQIAANFDEEAQKALGDLAPEVELKELGDLKARFIIVDGKEIGFMLLDDQEVHPSFDVGIWINTPYFSSAMQQMFELAWKSMKDVHITVKN